MATGTTAPLSETDGSNAARAPNTYDTADYLGYGGTCEGEQEKFRAIKSSKVYAKDRSSTPVLTQVFDDSLVPFLEALIRSSLSVPIFSREPK